MLRYFYSRITFFAPNNKALHLPHHRKPRHGLISLALSDPAAIPSDIYSSFDLSEIFSEIEEFEASLVDDENDPDKERRKKFIRILVRAILAYHILPQGLDAPQLARNTTYATNLTVPDGALDKEPLRIRVASSKLFPVIKINVLATVIKPDIGAKNGIIHVINHPLLPPPSIFQELFLFPPYFGGVVSLTIIHSRIYFKLCTDISTSTRRFDRCSRMALRVWRRQKMDCRGYWLYYFFRAVQYRF